MTVSPSILAEWLLRQITDDEKKALRITPGRNAANGQWRADSLEFAGMHEALVTEHIIRHDPAHALATCAAHRAIVEEAAKYAAGQRGYGMAASALRALALAYVDRPGYEDVL